MKYVPPSTQLPTRTYWVIYHISIQDLLGQGGHTLKFKMVMALYTGNEFALIYASMICMCITIKLKLLYILTIPLALGFIANHCSQNNRTVCFSSLNISGVRKCKY